MVTQKQADDTLVGPKASIWLIVLTIAVGAIAWVMASSAHQADQAAINSQVTPQVQTSGSSTSPSEMNLQTTQR